ncbi:MAG: PH domain-containing protein [Patescibacteria group bacterium]
MKITLNPNEIIIKSAHRHVIGVFLRILPHLLTLIILLILLSSTLYLDTLSNDWLLALAPIFRFMIAVGLIIDWLALGTMIMLEYFLTSFILTNERVIKIRQEGIFSKSIFISDIDRVQDIHVEQKGVIAHFYNFGTIRVTTASEVGEIFFNELPDPASFQKNIFDAINAHDNLKNNQNIIQQK